MRPGRGVRSWSHAVEARRMVRGEVGSMDHGRRRSVSRRHWRVGIANWGGGSERGPVKRVRDWGGCTCGPLGGGGCTVTTRLDATTLAGGIDCRHKTGLCARLEIQNPLQLGRVACWESTVVLKLLGIERVESLEPLRLGERAMDLKAFLFITALGMVSEEPLGSWEAIRGRAKRGFGSRLGDEEVNVSV